MAHSHQQRHQEVGLLGGTRRTVSRLVSSALDLMLPRTCAVCHREGQFICTACGADLPRLQDPYCERCADPGTARICSWCAASEPPYDGIRAPFLMQGGVRDMVYALKYRNLRASAPELAGLMAAELDSLPIQPDVLIPVPLHRRRERERGYNQSELLARDLSKISGLPMAARALRRIRNAPPQVSISGHDERWRNIDGAFQCSADVAGQSIVLIDDVVTTGSTIAACAGPLRAAGAASVWGLALARQG